MRASASTGTETRSTDRSDGRANGSGPIARGQEDEQRRNDHAFLHEMTPRGPSEDSGLDTKGVHGQRTLRAHARRATPDAPQPPSVPPDERDGRGGRRALLVHRRPPDPAGGRRDPRHRHAMADQARDLRDAREPELQQPLREVPRRPRNDDGRRERRRQAADPMPRMAARRHPPRSGRAPVLRERRSDGRLRHRDLRLDVRLHDLRRGPDPQLLALGARVLALGELLRVGGRAELPEPLLLHRRILGRGRRQPGEHPDPRGGRHELQELGLRRVRRRRVRLRDRRRREPHEARHLLRVPHRRRAAHRRRGRLGVLLGGPRAARLLLERLQRRLERVPHGPVARARPLGRHDSSTTSTRTPSRR